MATQFSFPVQTTFPSPLSRLATFSSVPVPSFVVEADADDPALEEDEDEDEALAPVEEA